MQEVQDSNPGLRTCVSSSKKLYASLQGGILWKIPGESLAYSKVEEGHGNPPHNLPLLRIPLCALHTILLDGSMVEIHRRRSPRVGCDSTAPTQSTKVCIWLKHRKLDGIGQLHWLAFISQYILLLVLKSLSSLIFINSTQISQHYSVKCTQNAIKQQCQLKLRYQHSIQSWKHQIRRKWITLWEVEL